MGEIIKTRILGIDPGTRNVGWGVVEASGANIRHIAHGVIVTKGDDLALRLVDIHRGLADAISQYSPAAAAVETVFSKVNPKTAIAIGEGRGVALLSAAEKGLTVTGYEPALVKRIITGNGAADKDQIQRMVQVLLCLTTAPDTDHESDALALAITHARHIGPDGELLRAKAKRPSRGRRPLPNHILQLLQAGQH